MQIESIHLYIQVFVGLAAIAGVVKSAWSGILKNLYIAARDIPEVHQRVREIPDIQKSVNRLHTQQDRMENTQEEMKDAIIALASSQGNEDVETDLTEVRRRLSDNHSSDYTKEGD